jgi:DNA polymerase (family 10)
MMLADQAQAIADIVIAALRPHCARIEVAGSLRRRRPEVGDLDLVVLHPDGFRFLEAIMTLYGRRPEKMGRKYICLTNFRGIQVDLYLADDLTWATLLLIRTGSKQHNIKLCQRALQEGYRLHANGAGLERVRFPGQILAVETERQVFEALGLPYKEPWEREA